MNVKALAAAGLLAVGVGAVGVAVLGVGGGGTGSATTYRTATATTTTVQQTAASSGNLVAATVYDLAFGEAPVARDGTAASSTASSTSASSSATSSSAAAGAADGVTVTWPVTAVEVEVGDLVEAGDVLATADATTAELAVRQAQANLAAARRQHRIDLAGGTSSTRASARAQVTSAQTQLANARSSYGSTVAQNNLRLRQARRAVDDAQSRLAADRRAGAPQATISADRAALRSAKQTLASTRLQAAAGNRSAANQVTSASQSVSSAKRTYRDATGAADDATLVADEVAIAEAEQALADAEAAAAAATITAPTDGRVTAVNVAVGDEASGTAIELQSTGLAVALAVAEDDVLDLAVGQPASVAITATGDTATGTVTSIDPVAATSGTSSVVSYTVVVTLDEPDAATASTTGGTAASSAPATVTQALPGMSAEVTVVIAEAPDTVAVPSIALSGTTGGYVVQVLGADGTIESRAVDVGLVASDYAQITGGLAAGETVVTGTSADRTTTSTTTATGRDGLGGGFGGLNGAGGFQPPAGGPPVIQP